MTNNIRYMGLSNKSVDDFLYFFGGGLTGLKGYTYYEPSLQGTNMFILTNSISFPVFTEKAYKNMFVYLNSLSFSVVHQMGKSDDGKIIMKYPLWKLSEVEAEAEKYSNPLEMIVNDAMSMYGRQSDNYQSNKETADFIRSYTYRSYRDKKYYF